jgi:hypothetical protein
MGTRSEATSGLVEKATEVLAYLKARGLPERLDTPLARMLLRMPVLPSDRTPINTSLSVSDEGTSLPSSQVN